MTWDPTIPCAGTDGALDGDRYVGDLIAHGIGESIHDGLAPSGKAQLHRASGVMIIDMNATGRVIQLSFIRVDQYALPS